MIFEIHIIELAAPAGTNGVRLPHHYAGCIYYI